MTKVTTALIWALVLTIFIPTMSHAQIGGKLKSLKKKVEKQLENTKEEVKGKTEKPKTHIPKVKMACDQREGTVIYKLKYPIYGGNSDRKPHFIQFVEVNESSTVLYFVSYGDWALSFAPVGSEATPHLMWNGTNEVGMSGADREKFLATKYHHAEQEREGMISATRSHYAIEFERIPNYVCKVHVYIPSTTQIQGEAFFDLKLDPATKVSREEMDATIAMQQCSFQGGDELTVDGTRTYRQGYEPQSTQHKWTVEGDAEIVGSDSEANVVLKGTKTGIAKLCLQANYGTEIDECSSCKEIAVVQSNEQTPWFDLAHCGNFTPYWGFEIIESARVEGATYKWEISAELPLQTNKEEIKPIKKDIAGDGFSVSKVKPPYRGAPFTVKVTASYPDGSTASHSQTFHHIFDCPNKSSRYMKRNVGLE